ncbi:YcaO-like family protein [Clostridium gasigenes]|uniref:YcaO-like family protein n=1 Tax=Clostridium gasigenes TaxID=94869 RepID=UPI001C0D3A66|nr:YcaO-like family protein [Clostridium gasigenes]MBU3089188.1 YcaO-like family protein [Clostridium gasigenes]
MENERQKNHYKIISPEITVNKIKAILKTIDIEVEEDWLPISSIETNSLRLQIKGSSIGTNGKGVSREYARASAYAEFMERLQNSWLTRYYFRGNKNNIYHSYDEKKFTIEDVIRMDNEFIKMILVQRNTNNLSDKEKFNVFKKLHKVEARLTGDDNNFIMLPFYCVRKRSVEYLPYNLYTSYYGSNGMCAGNSPEEALIQGFSEIMERYVGKLIITNKYTLPDIPDEYVAKFPYVYKMYMELKKIDGYTVMLKDGSLMGKYPVAVLIIIQKNTGFYGMKLGSHPDFGVAMERTFTEAAQGGDITEYVGKSVLNFGNNIVMNDVNISNMFKTGKGQLPFELLLDKPSFDFVEMPDVSEDSDTVMLNRLIETFVADGKDIFIRNVSYTGFPSFQVIIPTVSEMSEMTDRRFEYLEAKLFCEELLNYPNLITEKNCKTLIRVLEHYSTSLLDNSFRSLYGKFTNFNLPADETGFGWLYLVCMCHVYLGDYKSALNRLNFMISMMKSNKGYNLENIVYYQALEHYFHGMAVVGDHSCIISYLNLFYEDSIISRINELFIEPEQVIVKQYPIHDYRDIENCKEKKCCDNHAYCEVIEKVKKLQMSNSIDQIDIGSMINF